MSHESPPWALNSLGIMTSGLIVALNLKRILHILHWRGSLLIQHVKKFMKYTVI